ncbi:hypothetical protein [Variovorax sp. HJSM1_2]|uniref:hypothetical protein n=1 Tax=Variovorax sp. HJSM1_2 TaxID=3366263 RepID=UPI003BBAED1C
MTLALHTSQRSTALVCAFLALATSAAALASGRTAPEPSAKAQFQNYSSCPSTGKREGHCPGYRIGYKIGLCAGGQDRWSNMVWLTDAAYREQQQREAAACSRRNAPTVAPR